jgi:ATP-binding cassette subfamily F protein 3
MSLLSASDVAKSYGAQDVFSGVSLVIPRRARIALVGRNGIGKTTLLRVLIGLEKPDQGTVQRARSLQIGYLPQEASYSKSRRSELSDTLWDSMLQAFSALRAQEKTLASLEQKMANPDEAEDAMERYGPLQEAFEFAGGYTYPTQIRRVLNGLGFEEDEYKYPIRQLSGGERTRAVLARLLLENPDLLILDEPTNHLDLEAVEWLESWLREWNGAALMVSHDRYFLDHTVDRILEMSPMGLEAYRGNYSAYADQRIERRQRREAEYRAQQEHIQKEQEYIRRNIAGQNTRQAQGRRKRLERLLQESALSPVKEAQRVSVDFGEVKRSGDVVLETHDLEIGYSDSDTPLFLVPDLILHRGECVAIIGPNGAGKTTFLKTLLREVGPFGGDIHFGASLHVGYFAQAHEGLNPKNTVLDAILAVAPDLKISEVRSLLARFLFTGDTVEKRIEILSGGERARVALAVLALEGANFLMLDEPSNHLDIRSQEIFEQALGDFPGTILLVSHDRYLIDVLATQVWAVEPFERVLEVVKGGYAAYLEARREKVEKRKNKPKRNTSPVEKRRTRSRIGIEELETQIHEIETALAETAREIQAESDDHVKVQQLGRTYAELEKQLNAYLDRWESMAEE